jgi:hypothetical protein
MPWAAQADEDADDPMTWASQADEDAEQRRVEQAASFIETRAALWSD